MSKPQLKTKNLPADSKTTIRQLPNICLQFRAERNWTDQKAATFAKNIAVEAGELLEHFVWEEDVYLTDSETAQEIKYELVDVLFGILVLSDVLKMDVSNTLKEKIKILAQKYPADEYRKKIARNDKTAWKKWAN